MTELSALALGVPQAATATLAVMLVVPLAFLARPCRATLLWALAMIVAAGGVYTVVSAELAGAEQVRRVALGGMLAAVPLLWSGLRAWRGVRPRTWAAPVFAVAAIAALVLAPDDAYSVAFRIVFSGASVFAGLSALELRRLPERDTGPLIPLVVLCTLFAALGLAVLVGGFLAPGAAGDFSMVRAVNSIGVIAFLVCATLAVITLAQSGPAGPAAARDDVLRTFRSDAVESVPIAVTLLNKLLLPHLFQSGVDRASTHAVAARAIAAATKAARAGGDRTVRAETS